jgi:hypothetical protein
MTTHDPAEVERVARERVEDAIAALGEGGPGHVLTWHAMRRSMDDPSGATGRLDDALDTYAAFVRAQARRDAALEITGTNVAQQGWHSAALTMYREAEAELQRLSAEVMRPAAQEAE